MRAFRIAGISAVLAMLVLNIPVAGQPARRELSGFVIRNVRVFDGSRVIPKGDVWVQDGFIKAAGPEIAAPSDLPVIDGTGKTLLPGLIDARAHDG